MKKTKPKRGRPRKEIGFKNAEELSRWMLLEPLKARLQVHWALEIRRKEARDIIPSIPQHVDWNAQLMSGWDSERDMRNYHDGIQYGMACAFRFLFEQVNALKPKVNASLAISRRLDEEAHAKTPAEQEIARLNLSILPPNLVKMERQRRRSDNEKLLAKQFRVMMLVIKERVTGPPYVDEVAAEMGCSPSRIRQIVQHAKAAKKHISIERDSKGREHVVI